MKRLIFLFAVTSFAAPTPLNNLALVLPYEELEMRLRMAERTSNVFQGLPEARAYFDGRASVYRELIELLRLEAPKD